MFRTEAQETKISTKRVEYKSGTVSFTTFACKDTFEDGSVKEYIKYTKEDGREYTDRGRAFHIYKSKAAYTSGYYRAKSEAKVEQ